MKYFSKNLIWCCVWKCFLFSGGRVWVHHLSLSSSHCQNGDRQPLAATADCSSSIGFFFSPLICIHKQTKKLGWPLQEWKSAVVFSGTQVVNSNSTSAVQDPRIKTMPKLTLKMVGAVESFTTVLNILPDVFRLIYDDRYIIVKKAHMKRYLGMRTSSLCVAGCLGVALFWALLPFMTVGTYGYEGKTRKHSSRMPTARLPSVCVS